MLGQPQDSVLDLGPRKPAPGMQRFCAATGAVRPVDEMIRFVIGPDGVAVPDLKRRLPGRGIWITATRQALYAALGRKAFARAFKDDVRVTADVVDTTERLIERAALEALAICHKAGKVAIGFANVAAALARARVVAVCNAAGGPPPGPRKLAAPRPPRAGGRGKGEKPRPDASESGTGHACCCAQAFCRWQSRGTGSGGRNRSDGNTSSFKAVRPHGAAQPDR